MNVCFTFVKCTREKMLRIRNTFHKKRDEKYELECTQRLEEIKKLQREKWEICIECTHGGLEGSPAERWLNIVESEPEIPREESSPVTTFIKTSPRNFHQKPMFIKRCISFTKFFEVPGDKVQEHFFSSILDGFQTPPPQVSKLCRPSLGQFL